MLVFFKKTPCIYRVCGLIYSLSGGKWRLIPRIPHKVEDINNIHKVININEERFVALSMKGTFKHNIDSKGRLIIPAKIRDSLGSSFVITVGVDDCLSLYSIEEWENFTEKLDRQSNNKANIRMLKRYFRSNAADVEMDSQGRVVIPQDLRDSAGITKEVVIIGDGEKAEVWDRAKWDELQKQDIFDKENIRDMLESMDIDF